MGFFNLKKPDITEQLYNDHIADEVILVTRLVTLLGMIMFLGFYAVDFWAYTSVPHEKLIFVRLLVSGILGSVFLSTYSPTIFEKYRPYILPIPYLVASLGISYMIMLAGVGDYASEIYFVGLILIIMMLFAWSFLHLSISLSISIFILSLYSYIEFTGNAVLEEETFKPHLLINLSFLISAAIIGFFSQLIRDRHLRQNFLLHQSLAKAYEAKAIEAKDNEYLARHDSLTGLPNRRYMMELLEKSMIEAKSKNKVLIIMFLDLNGFKQINDIYGHAIGDSVLKVIAKRLEMTIRKEDHVSRLGGDEYLVSLMMHKDRLGEVEEITQKFSETIAQPMSVEGIRVKVGSSIGLSAYPIHGDKVSVLLDIADKRMYDAKKYRNNPLSSQTIIEDPENKIAIFHNKNI